MPKTPNRVGPEGSRNAPFVLVGEAPGQHEDRLKRPFVGPSGAELAKWWHDAGLHRRQFYITNLHQYWPGKGDKAINAVMKKGTLFKEGRKKPLRTQFDEDRDRLKNEIEALAGPKVIVPTGNWALKALLGLDKVTKWRGSILRYVRQDGKVLKVIPTIHPAATFRQPQMIAACRADWKRIAEEADLPFDLPYRVTIVLQPSYFEFDLARIRKEWLAKATKLVIDIETSPDTGEILCCGFAAGPSKCFVVPLTETWWRSKKGLARAWEVVKELLACPLPKVLHNGLYDAFWLKQCLGLEINNWTEDTLAKDHVRDPMSPHDLGYLGSIFTREPYWKERWKGGTFEDLCYYNGLDVGVTYEVDDRLNTVIKDRRQFYQETYPPLWKPLLRLATHGIRVDRQKADSIFQTLKEETESLRKQIRELTNADPFGPSGGLSPKKLQAILFDDLGLPIMTNRRTGKPTTDHKALKKLQARYPERVGEIIPALLAFQKAKKRMEVVQPSNFDSDNRMRSSYRPFALSGRMMSSENPMGTGRNAQNVDRSLRDPFIPDEGCVFLQPDLSQAEDRVTKMLTGSPRLIEIARSLPGAFDVHRRNAAVIFEKEESEVTGDERYVSKRIRHGFNYGMGPAIMSETLIGDGFIYSIQEIAHYFKKVAEDTPEILDWQARTRNEVMQNRALMNTWGRVLYFDGTRLDDHAWKEAYAFLPQSEVADLMNRWGFIALDEWLQAQNDRPGRINAHTHDGMLISVRPEYAWDVLMFLYNSLERPRVYRGEAMTIWLEVKMGIDWSFKGAGTEWKRPPSRSEFESVLAECVQKVWWNR